MEKVDLIDTYCRNKGCLNSLSMYVGPKIPANTVKKDNLFPQIWAFLSYVQTEVGHQSMTFHQ